MLMQEIINMYSKDRLHLQNLLFLGSGPPKDHTVHVVELKRISTGLFVFLAIVATIGIILSSIFLAINVKFREER